MTNGISTINKALLISENKRIAVSLRGVLGKNGIDIETGFLNLHSLPMIRKIIAKNRNTAFIRSDFSRYLREVGNPFMIIIDGEIDLLTGGDTGPDAMKLLRTFLISYVILSRGKGFEQLKGSFVILNGTQQMPAAIQMENHPQVVLGMLATKDAIVNSFINDLKNNIARYHNLFLLKTLNIELPMGEMTEKMNRIIKSIREHERRGEVPQEDRSATALMEKGDFSAAKVIYRIDDSRVFVDGDIHDLSTLDGVPADLRVREFYIIGHWTGKTLLEVSNKITGAVVRGIATHKFELSDDIVINLDDGCVIDGATVTSIAQILVKDLSAYRNIRVHATEENRRIMENSTGFSLIRQYLD